MTQYKLRKKRLMVLLYTLDELLINIRLTNNKIKETDFFIADCFLLINKKNVQQRYLYIFLYQLITSGCKIKIEEHIERHIQLDYSQLIAN